jgi:hypothetical protein
LYCTIVFLSPEGYLGKHRSRWWSCPGRGYPPGPILDVLEELAARDVVIRHGQTS